MPTPKETAASLDAATKDLVEAIGVYKTATGGDRAARWPVEFNKARTDSVTSGAGGSNVPKTGSGTAASKIPPSASEAKSTLPPTSTNNPKSTGPRL